MLDIRESYLSYISEDVLSHVVLPLLDREGLESLESLYPLQSKLDFARLLKINGNMHYFSVCRALDDSLLNRIAHKITRLNFNNELFVNPCVLVLKKCINVNEISLSNNKLTDEDLKLILEVNRSYLKIILSHNSLTDEGGLMLADFLKDKKLEFLDVSHNSLRSPSINALAELTQITTIKDLHQN